MNLQESQVHAGKSLTSPPKGVSSVAVEVGEVCPPSRFLQALLTKADTSISSNLQGKEERSFDGEAT